MINVVGWYNHICAQTFVPWKILSEMISFHGSLYMKDIQIFINP